MASRYISMRTKELEDKDLFFEAIGRIVIVLEGDMAWLAELGQA